MTRTPYTLKAGLIAVGLLVSACGGGGEEGGGGAGASIAGTYNCGPDPATGLPREVWELRDGGTLTRSATGERKPGGTWSVEGDRGAVHLEGSPPRGSQLQLGKDLSFTLEGDRLDFGPVEPGSSIKWVCTPGA
jgi:hypothetical protein